MFQKKSLILQKITRPNTHYMLKLLIKQYIKYPTVFLGGFLKSFFLKEKRMEDPIDFVVTWVNGSDPVWKAEKLKYEGKDAESTGDSSDERYRNWDLFRYWFRAVEQYAPWVNKVYLVTYGHIPSWLNTECKKLVIINHKDYIPAKYLPTFSSVPIELNLFRIKDLSENFVYFNDDTILNCPVNPEDFFQDGLPRICSIATPAQNSPDNEVFAHQLFTGFGFMNKYNWEDIIQKTSSKWFHHSYGVRLLYNWHAYQNRFFTGMYFTHMPQAFRKQTMKAVWEEFGKELDEISSHRFRSPMDCNHHIFTMKEVVNGSYVPMKPFYYGRIDELMAEHAETFAGNIRQKSCRIVCVNDTKSINSKNFESVRNTMEQAFREVLPTPSSFEKEN